MKRILIVNNRPPESGIGRYVNKLVSTINAGYPQIYVRQYYWSGGIYDSLFSRASTTNNLTLVYTADALRILSQTQFILRAPRNFDIYHLGNPSLTFAFSTRKPTVVTVHDMIPFLEPRARADLFMLRTIRNVKRADRIICTSESTKRDLLHFLQVDPSRVTVIYHGVDHELFKTRDKRAARARLGLRIDSPVLLNVGTEEIRKNIPTLFRAFQKVLAEFPHAVLIRVGRQIPSISKLALELGVSDHVMYMNLRDLELALAYNAADAYVSPSYSEGFGLPLLEAMSSGCPILSSTKTAIPEIIGDAGILLEPFDVDLYVTWLRRLLTNEALRFEYSQASQLRSLDFSWTKCAMETLGVYAKVSQE